MMEAASILRGTPDRPILLPWSVHYELREGVKAFFAEPAPRQPNKIVQRVLSGRAFAAHVRYPDGSLVIVRRKA